MRNSKRKVMFMEKSDKPQISIIVPIFNVDEYLYRCLYSISSQTYENFEVVMVDDGSTDESFSIAQGFEAADGRFKLYKNTVKGVSFARNFGLEKAQGEYLAFVDSDDFVDPHYLHRLYYRAKSTKADVVCCNYAVYTQESGDIHTIKLRKPRKGEYSSEKAVKKTVSDWSMRSYLWNKLWKRELFMENNIRFPHMYFEDLAMVSTLLYFANKVVVIDQCLYYYTRRKDSIVYSTNINKINDYVLSLGVLRNFFEQQGDYKRYRLSHLHLATTMFFVNFYNIFMIHRKSMNLHGVFGNFTASCKSIFYFISKKYVIVYDTLPAMQKLMCFPPDKRRDPEPFFDKESIHIPIIKRLKVKKEEAKEETNG